MPASKKKYFTTNENEIANIARALCHPARIRIMSILNQGNPIRNCDLIDELKMAKSTIHDHLKKMEEAKLISMDYFMNSFYITLHSESSETIDKIKNVKSVLYKS